MGVAVGVGQVDQVAIGIVCVGCGVLRIRAGGLDHAAKLIRVVVGVVDGVVGLVGDAGQVAGAIVAVQGRRGVVIRRLRQPFPRVVLLLGDVALRICHQNLIARIVKGVLRGVVRRIHGADQAAGGVVIVGSGVLVRIGLGGLMKMRSR